MWTVMSMSSQQTLTGETADTDTVETPRTLIWCDDCQDYILRSERFDHEHDMMTPINIPKTMGGADSDEDSEEEEEDEEPEEVGSYYDVTLEYNVTYRFSVPAYSEHEAKDIAKDWQLDARPADSYHVHTETREGKSIMSTDTPDDWDMYGSELLWEALERAAETNSAADDLDDGGEP